MQATCAGHVAGAEDVGVVPSAQGAPQLLRLHIPDPQSGVIRPAQQSATWGTSTQVSDS